MACVSVPSSHAVPGLFWVTQSPYAPDANKSIGLPQLAISRWPWPIRARHARSSSHTHPRSLSSPGFTQRTASSSPSPTNIYLPSLPSSPNATSFAPSTLAWSFHCSCIHAPSPPAHLRLSVNRFVEVNFCRNETEDSSHRRVHCDEDEAQAGGRRPSRDAALAMEGSEEKQEEVNEAKEGIEGGEAAPHDPEAVLGEVRGRRRVGGCGRVSAC